MAKWQEESENIRKSIHKKVRVLVPPGSNLANELPQLAVWASRDTPSVVGGDGNDRWLDVTLTLHGNWLDADPNPS